MDRKNKPYLVCAVLFALNNLVVSILKHLSVLLTPFLNGFLTVLYFLPIIVALFIAGKDTQIKHPFRIIAIIVAVFICFCLISSVVLIILDQQG